MNLIKNKTIIEPRSVEQASIGGLYVITMKQISDGRGTIREFFRASSVDELHTNNLGSWSQINVTETLQGAIRGIHAENMNKLVGMISGEGFGVYVDLRRESPTRGVVFTTKLTSGIQVFVPKGVGNGFQSTSEGSTQYAYCFDAEWKPGMPGTSLNPLDPELKIDWPIKIDKTDQNLISQKDISAPLLNEIFQ